MVRMRRVAVLCLLLLVILSLCVLPPALADSQPADSGKAESIARKAAKTSSASSSSSPASPSRSKAAPEESLSDREVRLERKSKRQAASRNRVESSVRRVQDKARKNLKRYRELLKGRVERLQLKERRRDKQREKSEQYWSMKKDSMSEAVMRKGEKRRSKLSDLSAAAAASSSPLLQLKESQFNDLIAASPRPYWVLLSLTALSKQYECKICQAAHRAFVSLAPTVQEHTAALLNASSASAAAGYNTMLSFNASVSAAERERLQREHDDEVKRGLPVFLVEMDIDSNRNVFNTLQLTTAPTIVMLPPTFASKPAAVASLLSVLPSRFRFVPQSMEMTAATFLDFMNPFLTPQVGKGAGGAAGDGGGWLQAVEDRVRAFNPIILFYFTAIAGFLLLYLLVTLLLSSSYCRRKDEAQQPFSLIAYFLPSSSSVPASAYAKTASGISTLNFHQLRRLLSRLPLILAALTFYLFCISGGMFTIIKDSETGDADHWISNQYMDQTVSESAVLTLLYLLLSALIVLVNSRSFHWRAEDSGLWSRVLSWLLSCLLSPLWLLAAFVFVWLQLVNIYGKKNSYHWGVNWRWLRDLQWDKIIRWPAFHRYVNMAWTLIQKRLI